LTKKLCPDGGAQKKKAQKLVANPLKCTPRDPALRRATLVHPWPA